MCKSEIFIHAKIIVKIIFIFGGRRFMWTSNFAGGAIIFIFGIIVRVFKASFLIAGYNTASKEAKERYDEEKLTRFVGNLLMLSGGILIVGGFITFLWNLPAYIAGISWALFIVTIVVGIIYMNTGRRFEKKEV